MSETKDAGPPATMQTRNFEAAGFRYNRWQADLDENQTLEQALEPTFWRHVSTKIMGHNQATPKGRGDLIEVRKLDTGLYAELLITEIGNGYVKVAMLRMAEPDVADVPDDAPFLTRWNVGKRGHEVLRRADKMVMSGPFQSKAGAVAWISDHMAKMAA